MKLTYIFHSCFVIEDEDCTLVFDFYKDSVQNYVSEHLKSFPGKLYVFSSHSHHDHFNKDILEWKNYRPDIQFIFSGDIVDNGLYTPGDACILRKGEVFEDQLVSVKAFGSTDLGISFLVNCSGKKIFHAGDLNNWHWKEESTFEEINEAENFYLSELEDVIRETSQLDVLMYPVDPRLGGDCALGAKQLLQKIKVDLFVPMHCWERYQEANVFATEAESFGCRYFKIENQGDSISL